MKSLKQNFDKHLVVTVIVLVILPILLGSSTFVLSFYQSQVISFFEQIFNDFREVYKIASQFFALLVQLQYVIFVAMLVFYPLYPFIFSLENHLSKRKPKSVLLEYQLLKKLVYALLPIFFFAVVLRLSSIITPQNPFVNLVRSLDPLSQSIIVSILAVVFFTVASALLRIILLNGSRDFKFYLARLSLRAMSNTEDDLERIKYVIEGLSYYNKYIRRILGLEINGLKMIYSKIIADAAIDKNQLMKELHKAFEDRDKLKPVRCLTLLFNVPEPKDFLVKEPIGKKLEDWGGIIGTLASTITAIIGAILTLLSTSARA